METGTDKKEITAKKLAEGQVLTQISGNGADVLQMLAMLQRSVAIILMGNGASPTTAAVTLLQAMEMGLDMAVKDRSGK